MIACLLLDTNINKNAAAQRKILRAYLCGKEKPSRTHGGARLGKMS